MSNLNSKLAMFAVGLVLCFAITLCDFQAANAQTCPGGTTNVCPSIENVSTLQNNTMSPPPFVYTSGYSLDGDGGGGVLYKLNGTSCSSNGGTVIQDSNTPKNCYYAQTFPQNVLQWGAKCDAALLGAPVLVAVGASSIETPIATSIYSIVHGTSLVIIGAGPSGGTLATTVNTVGLPMTFTPTGSTTAGSNSVTVSSTSGIVVGMLIRDNSMGAYIPGSTIVIGIGSSAITMSNVAISTHSSIGLRITGTLITLNPPLPATNTPVFVAVKANVVAGGVSYQTGDTITLADGTVLEVMTGVAGMPIPSADANVQMQTQDSFIPAMPISQSSTSGSGSGATFNLQMTATGQMWYGTDDTVAINNALASALPASDIWLPANRTCGVTANSNSGLTNGAVQLPIGNNSLRGWDRNSSGLVELGSPTPIASVSYVVARTNGSVTGGGGMRDLFVEGNGLVSNTCAVEGGEEQLYENVDCKDAAPSGSEWLCGYPGGTQSQINGTLFLHIRGETDFNLFGPVSQLAADDFLVTSSCEGEHVDDAYFGASQIAGVYDSQSDYNLYSGVFVDSVQPFNQQYCFEFSGHQAAIGDRCTNPSTAGVYLTGNFATVDNIFEQWQNAVPSSATCGVSIASGSQGDLVTGVNTGGYLASGRTDYTSSPANVVCQQGTADPSTLAVNNIGAAYAGVGGAGSTGFIRVKGAGQSDMLAIADDTVLWTSTAVHTKTETIPGCSGTFSSGTPATVGANKKFTITDDGSNFGASAMTVTPASTMPATTINQASSLSMTTTNQSVTLECDGISNYVIVASH